MKPEMLRIKPDALRIRSIPAQLRRVGRQLLRSALAMRQAGQGLQAQEQGKRGDVWQARAGRGKFRLDFFWKIGKVADTADALQQNAAKERQRLPDQLVPRPFQTATPCTTRQLNVISKKCCWH
jgi:hypothetical protein